MKDLQIFNYKEKEVRMVSINEETWWVAKDLCNCLEVKQPEVAIKRLDEEDKLKVNTNDLTLISNKKGEISTHKMRYL